MHWQGILVGLVTFAIIGACHPLVIKVEYYFSARIWPLFLVCGLGLCAASLFIEQQILSVIAAVAGFCLLWGIGELKRQQERVENGWFPSNPARELRKNEKKSNKYEHLL